MVNLADLDSLYNETPAAPEMDFLPPGTYQGHIVKAEMGKTRDTDFPMLTLRLKVAVGPYRGRMEFFRITFRDTPDSIKFAKRDLQHLGFKGPLSQLESSTDEFEGKAFSFKVDEKMKNGTLQRNVYLGKQVTIAESYELPGGLDVSPPPMEDELPF